MLKLSNLQLLTIASSLLLASFGKAVEGGIPNLSDLSVESLAKNENCEANIWSFVQQDKRDDYLQRNLQQVARMGQLYNLWQKSLAVKNPELYNGSFFGLIKSGFSKDFDKSVKNYKKFVSTAETQLKSVEADLKEAQQDRIMDVSRIFFRDVQDRFKIMIRDIC